MLLKEIEAVKVAATWADVRLTVNEFCVNRYSAHIDGYSYQLRKSALKAIGAIADRNARKRAK